MEEGSSIRFSGEFDAQSPLDRLYQRDHFAADEPKIKPLRTHTFSKLNTSQDIAFRNLQLTNTGLYVLKKAYRDLEFDQIQDQEVQQIYENAVAKLKADQAKRLRKYDQSHGTKAWVVTHAFRWVKSGYYEMRMRKLTKSTFKKMEKACARTDVGIRKDVRARKGEKKIRAKYLDREFSVIYEAHVSAAVEKHLKIEGNYESILGAKETAHRKAPDMDSLAKQEYIESFLKDYVNEELPDGYKKIGHSLAQHMIRSFQKEQTSKSAIRNQFKTSVIRSYENTKDSPPSAEYLQKLDKFLDNHFDNIYELCEEAYIPPFRTSMEAKLTMKGDPGEKSQMLVNPWQEVVTRGGETMEVARSGAYTDFTDTGTNIKKLEEKTKALSDEISVIDKALESLEDCSNRLEELVEGFPPREGIEEFEEEPLSLAGPPQTREQLQARQKEFTEKLEAFETKLSELQKNELKQASYLAAVSIQKGALKHALIVQQLNVLSSPLYSTLDSKNPIEREFARLLTAEMDGWTLIFDGNNKIDTNAKCIHIPVKAPLKTPTGDTFTIQPSLFIKHIDEINDDSIDKEYLDDLKERSKTWAVELTASRQANQINLEAYTSLMKQYDALKDHLNTVDNVKAFERLLTQPFPMAKLEASYSNQCQALAEELEELQEESMQIGMQLAARKATCQKEITQLETTLAKRKETVRQMAGTAIAQQALQLAKHDKERIDENLGRPDYMFEQGCFYFSQVSLVHAEADGKEGNMLQDMVWALNEEFAYKLIIFDGSCGIDDAGNIHVPHSITNHGSDDPIQLAITPKLYNCTVKGKKPKSTEMQDDVNKKALSSLESDVKGFKTWHKETYMPWLDKTIKGLEQKGRKRSKTDTANLQKLRKERRQLKANPPGPAIDAKLAAIKEKIEGSKSGYDLAVEISEIEMLMHSRVAINCKSGKDRTGLLFNKLTTNFFVRNSPKKPSSEEAIKKARHKVAKEVDKNSASRPITGMNVLIKGFKRHPREIEGRSIYARIRNSVMGLLVFS